MAENASGLIRSSKKLGALGLGSFAVAAAFMSLGSGTASAEVEEVAPSPQVTSRQALIIDDNSLRASAIGEARGFLDTRSADSGIVHAQGELLPSASGSRPGPGRELPGRAAVGGHAVRRDSLSNVPTERGDLCQRSSITCRS